MKGEIIGGNFPLWNPNKGTHIPELTNHKEGINKGDQLRTKGKGINYIYLFPLHISIIMLSKLYFIL